MNPAIRFIRVGLLAASFAIAAAGSLWADTIYLKNGRKIYATNIVKQDGKLVFDTAGGTVSVSESLVDKVVSDDSESTLELAAKPKPAREVVTSPTPTAAIPKPNPEPASVKAQRHLSRLTAARPTRVPRPKPADLRSADVPKLEQAMLVLPQIDASLPVPPREATNWFLSDSPAGHSGEGDRSVHVGGFAAAVDPESGTGNRAAEARVVQAGTFQSVQVVPPHAAENPAVQSVEPTEAVVVLSGPKAGYTDEARKLGIEGQVLLDVVFQASGEVKVNRVLQGLGHGLDDESVRAAQQIRFKPATQEGHAVDYPATLHIVFQLTN